MAQAALLSGAASAVKDSGILTDVLQGVRGFVADMVKGVGSAPRGGRPEEIMDVLGAATRKGVLTAMGDYPGSKRLEGSKKAKDSDDGDGGDGAGDADADMDAPRPLFRRDPRDLPGYRKPAPAAPKKTPRADREEPVERYAANTRLMPAPASGLTAANVRRRALEELAGEPTVPLPPSQPVASPTPGRPGWQTVDLYAPETMSAMGGGAFRPMQISAPSLSSVANERPMMMRGGATARVVPFSRRIVREEEEDFVDEEEEAPRRRRGRGAPPPRSKPPKRRAPAAMPAAPRPSAERAVSGTSGLGVLGDLDRWEKTAALAKLLIGTWKDDKAPSAPAPRRGAAAPPARKARKKKPAPKFRDYYS